MDVQHSSKGLPLQDTVSKETCPRPWARKLGQLYLLIWLFIYLSLLCSIAAFQLMLWIQRNQIASCKQWLRLWRQNTPSNYQWQYAETKDAIIDNFTLLSLQWMLKRHGVNIINKHKGICVSREDMLPGHCTPTHKMVPKCVSDSD